jgi:hypothetical protein
MERFELSVNDMNKLITQDPLLIVRLSILNPGLPNTMRPVRKRPYQDHTFALRIPLELDDDGLDFFKLEHLSWLCLLALSKCSVFMNPLQASIKWYLPWWIILNLHFIIFKMYWSILTLFFAHWLDQHCTSSSFSIMMVSWECTWELTPYYSSRHTLYRLNSLMTNLRITPWIPPWS